MSAVRRAARTERELACAYDAAAEPDHALARLIAMNKQPPPSPRSRVRRTRGPSLTAHQEMLHDYLNRRPHAGT